MSRIAPAFDALRKQGRKALIPFITAGDPDPRATVPLMHALAKAGCDVIELGVPFSDPMADGPVIQRSSERALRKGVSLKDVLGYVAEFRRTDDRTPIVVFGYANPIEALGVERFADAAQAAGVDGVLVVALVGSGFTFGKSPENTPLATPLASRKPGNTLPDPSVKSTITRRPACTPFGTARTSSQPR